MKIGIPRYMFYQEYPLLHRFLSNLGVETVLSPRTNKAILEAGRDVALSEFCYPIKLYCGHVQYLRKQGIDKIFIPIITGHQNETAFPCFSQIRIIDIIKNLEIAPDNLLLTAPFTYSDKGLLNKGFYELGEKLNKTKAEIDRALNMSIPEKQTPEKQTPEKQTNDDVRTGSQLTIGIAGRQYVLHDTFTNMGVRQKLINMGCRAVFGSLLPAPIEKQNIPSHFSMTTSVTQQIINFDQNKTIDGIIYLQPFNCGPDCSVEMGVKSYGLNTPFMTVVIDELTTDTNITTRIEAFVDMIINHQSLTIKALTPKALTSKAVAI